MNVLSKRFTLEEHSENSSYCISNSNQSCSMNTRLRELDGIPNLCTVILSTVTPFDHLAYDQPYTGFC
jgi:hypothetical protein